MNSCGGFVVGTTSCLTPPDSVRQVNGVGVGVAGTGLGVEVTDIVGDGGTTIGVETLRVLFVGEQAESPARSEK